MKKLSVILVGLITMTLSLTVQANDYTTPDADSLNAPTIKLVTSQEAKKVKLIYQAPEKENFRVRIFDEENRQIYSYFFKAKDQLTIPFDFNQAPAGEYSFELVGKDWKFSDKVELKPEAKELKADLNLISSSKLVHLKVENPGTNRVYVIVRDANDQVLLDDLVDLDENGMRTFNLAGVNTDLVTFVILGDSKTFKRQIRF